MRIDGGQRQPIGPLVAVRHLLLPLEVVSGTLLDELMNWQCCANERCMQLQKADTLQWDDEAAAPLQLWQTRASSCMAPSLA